MQCFSPAACPLLDPFKNIQTPPHERSLTYFSAIKTFDSTAVRAIKLFAEDLLMEVETYLLKL